jgi:hypothetical protein
MALRASVEQRAEVLEATRIAITCTFRERSSVDLLNRLSITAAHRGLPVKSTPCPDNGSDRVLRNGPEGLGQPHGNSTGTPNEKDVSVATLGDKTRDLDLQPELTDQHPACSGVSIATDSIVFTVSSRHGR